MAEIRHRIGIAAPKRRVYEALSTVEGLSSWWSTTEGDPDVDGKLKFFFGQPQPAAIMEVISLKSPEHVGWLCVGGIDEWIDTNISFDLSELPDETVLRFAQTNVADPMPEFMENCSTKWGVHLLGIKSLLEGGTSNAFPNDPTISSWG